MSLFIMLKLPKAFERVQQHEKEIFKSAAVSFKAGLEIRAPARCHYLLQARSFFPSPSLNKALSSAAPAYTLYK